MLDLLVDDQIVVELKAARRLEDIHFVILRSYLKALEREHGLLLNFAGTSLEIKRVFSRTVEDSSRLPPGFLGSRVPPPASLSRRTGGRERVVDRSLPLGIDVPNL